MVLIPARGKDRQASGNKRSSEPRKPARAVSCPFLKVVSYMQAYLKMSSPGGPYIKHPFGGVIPSVLNLSACCIGNTLRLVSDPSTHTEVTHIASTSSSICLSKPPMSVYVSVGRSSTSIALTRASYSACTVSIYSSMFADCSPAGSLSRMRYESLFTPMRSVGRSSLWGTRPMIGRKMVYSGQLSSSTQPIQPTCLVEVLMTAHLLFFALCSLCVAPSWTSLSTSNIYLPSVIQPMILTMTSSLRPPWKPSTATPYSA